MNTSTNITKCMAYLNKMDAAVSGSGGHNQTLKAALACKRFGLTAGETWQAMTWFNDNRCSPRWKEHELRHKIESVAGMAIKKPLGQAHYNSRLANFVAPAVIDRQSDTRPIIERSEQEEELWWSRVAIERGTTLEAWDGI